MNLRIQLSILVILPLALIPLACSKTYSLPPLAAVSNPTPTPIPGAGVSWTEASTTAPTGYREGQSTVVYNNEMWLIGGFTGSEMNDVWNSTNGITWNEATAAAAFSGRERHDSVVFNGAMWVVGGGLYNGSNWVCDSDVWSSTDGITWNEATAAAGFNTRMEFGLVVFKNAMWLIGGYDGTNVYDDVWTSNNGTSWTHVTNGPFGYRTNLTALVFNNLMWVIGGNYNGTNYTDVWSSPDGTNWTEATASAGFNGRGYQTSVVFNNEMWVIAGAYYNGTSWSFLSDVWASPNGTNWTQTDASGPFGPLGNHSSVVYNNEMWVIDGQNGTNSTNQIWHSP